MATKNKAKNKADKIKEKQALVIITKLFPKIKAELDKRNIKYKNSADAIIKFYKEVVRGKKNLETIEVGYFEYLNKEMGDEGIAPVLAVIIPLLPVIIPLLTEIVKFFQSQKGNEDVLNDINNSLPKADEMIKDDEIIGVANPKPTTPNMGSPFTSGLSIGMILAIGVGIFVLMKMKK